MKLHLTAVFALQRAKREEIELFLNWMLVCQLSARFKIPIAERIRVFTVPKSSPVRVAISVWSCLRSRPGSANHLALRTDSCAITAASLQHQILRSVGFDVRGQDHAIFVKLLVFPAAPAAYAGNCPGAGATKASLPGSRAQVPNL